MLGNVRALISSDFRRGTRIAQSRGRTASLMQRLMLTHELSYDVLTHLLENPRSQDTLEGITEWWLLEQRIRCAVRQVREALAELMARGFVAKKSGRDGQARYAVVAERLGDIQALAGRTC